MQEPLVQLRTLDRQPLPPNDRVARGEAAQPPAAPARHFHRPIERGMVRREREHVTILFGGGLTVQHDRLILRAMETLGYKLALVPVPRKVDFQTGKEYGNNGQCNPTYFTVGTLVNCLIRLRDEEGIPTEKILSDYVFVTGGACGPCRFGMYEAEYRLALRNAGFDGFRVILFSVTQGLAQDTDGVGIDMNSVFFLGIVNGILMGDLINELTHQIRPYAIDPEGAEAVREQMMEICEDAMYTKDHEVYRGGLLGKVLGRIAPPDSPGDGAALLDQVRSPHYAEAFARCRRLLDQEIEVDYLRPKPVVKITGEFWAQATEGDGNFRMFEFLEAEGAEILVEPITTWLNYMVREARRNITDRNGYEGSDRPGFWQLKKRFSQQANNVLTVAALKLGEKLLLHSYERLRKALGGTAHPQVCQLELERLAHPYYNSRSSGGEGHLEVAKNIYYHHRNLSHMVISFKPFGCMPSTQSDGAQAAVAAHFPDVNFLPIETSGEGDINARSRVQMALGEAKAKCKAEFKAAVERSGHSLDEIRAYVAEHRELRSPLLHIPHPEGVAGTAARFVLHVGSLIDREPKQDTVN